MRCENFQPTLIAFSYLRESNIEDDEKPGSAEDINLDDVSEEYHQSIQQMNAEKTRALMAWKVGKHQCDSARVQPTS